MLVIINNMFLFLLVKLPFSLSAHVAKASLAFLNIMIETRAKQQAQLCQSSLRCYILFG